MLPLLGILRKLALILLCIALPTMAMAAAAPVAVFPLLSLSQGPNGIDLPLTTYLSGRLAEQGTVIAPQKTVIAFMAYNRIRLAGQLETYQLKQAQEELGAPFVLLGRSSSKRRSGCCPWGSP